MDNESRYLLCSLERTLQLLNCFSYEHPEWGVTELAKKLGMNKSTVHRMLSTLETHGAVEKKGDHRYSVGVRLFELGNVYRASADLVGISQPLLERLSHQIRSTVRLSKLKEGMVRDILRVEFVEPTQVQPARPARRAATNSAAGKVLLSGMSEAALGDFVRQYGMPPHTIHLVSNPESLREELQEIRVQGYALSHEASADWLRELAVPIFDDRSSICCALSTSVSLRQLPLRRVPILAERIKFFAGRISCQLGYIAAIP
jgi:IclR family KDG regulon transcriptional repressor